MNDDAIKFLEVKNLKNKLDFYMKSVEIFDKYLEILKNLLKYNDEAEGKIKFNRIGWRVNFYISGIGTQKDYELADFTLCEVILDKNAHTTKNKCLGGRNEIATSYNQVKSKKVEYEKEINEMQKDLKIRQKYSPQMDAEIKKIEATEMSASEVKEKKEIQKENKTNKNVLIKDVLTPEEESELTEVESGELRRAVRSYVKEFKLEKGMTVDKETRKIMFTKILKEKKIRIKYSSMCTELRGEGYCKIHDR